MTTLRVCVQKQLSDGYYPVYIRVIYGRQSGFIKTDKMVDRKSITKTREIRDNMVLKYCTELIIEYNNKLNKQGTSQWSVKEIISFQTTEQSDVSFSEYARLHIKRMINSGHNRNAKNYRLAVASLEQYLHRRPRPDPQGQVHLPCRKLPHEGRNIQRLTTYIETWEIKNGKIRLPKKQQKLL